MLMLLVLACSATTARAPLPAETVAAFYSAVNTAAYKEAKDYLAPEALEAVRGDAALRHFGDAQVSDRTLERIEILKEEVRGDLAEVRVELYFDSGLALHRGLLVRRNGIWKIKALSS
jgi:hypothetical protein